MDAKSKGSMENKPISIRLGELKQAIYNLISKSNVNTNTITGLTIGRTVKILLREALIICNEIEIDSDSDEIKKLDLKVKEYCIKRNLRI